MASQNAETMVSFEMQESLYKQALAKLDLDPLIVQHRFRIENALSAARLFEKAGDYLDAAKLAQDCRALADEEQEAEKAYIYDRSVRLYAEDPKEHSAKLEKAFTALGEYKDAKKYAQDCRLLVKKAERTHRGRLAGVILVLLILVCGIGWGFTSGAFTYLKGRVFMMAGMYNYAIDSFASLDGRFGAEALSLSCEFESMRAGSAGSTIYFGDYKWKLLEKNEKEQTVWLIAADVGEGHDFKAVPFHNTAEEVTWETSDLRKWLNTEIYETHFRDQERAYIIETQRPGSRSSAYGTAYAQDTQDLLAPLSEEEAARYEEILSGLGNDCWLRTPGNTLDTAAFISSSHLVRTYGMPVDEALCVRPVIQVSYAYE